MKLILGLQIISEVTTKMTHLLSFNSGFLWEFPGSPVVRTRRFHCLSLGSIPGWGAKILQAAQHDQIKTKQNKTKKLWFSFWPQNFSEKCLIVSTILPKQMLEKMRLAFILDDSLHHKTGLALADFAVKTKSLFLNCSMGGQRW